MFVKLIEGHEPFACNPDQVCAVEGLAGGRACMVYLSSGSSKRIGLSVDDVLRRFAHARPDDWLDGAASRTRDAEAKNARRGRT